MSANYKISSECYFCKEPITEADIIDFYEKADGTRVYFHEGCFHRMVEIGDWQLAFQEKAEDERH